jgi:hypothetical protein
MERFIFDWKTRMTEVCNIVISPFPDRVTDLHRTAIKGHVASATPGHGTLQPPDVLAHKLEGQRFGRKLLPM